MNISHELSIYLVGIAILSIAMVIKIFLYSSEENQFPQD